MCGITGFTGEKNSDLLCAMCRTLSHRGPDSEGYLEDEGISLGMRRLAIVDLESGQQPICNETEDIWTVFNGEIYDHLELRRKLIECGHSFRTHHSDTEVIVHLYEEFGEEWVTRINGMFGLALWDRKERKLLLYRDRLGKKPLYYSLKNGGIVFASEIKAILKHPRISKELDPEAIYHYFGQKNISAPASVYADIRQLLPGHYLLWRESSAEVRSYWQADFSPFDREIPEKEAAAEINRLLERAVESRMNCDVPFGAYLSGGLDSSFVVSLMSRHSLRPVKTFCLGYEDAPRGQFAGKAQDVSNAKRTAERLGTEHYEYIINAKQFADQMPEILAAFDEPFSGTVSTYFLSILIKQHVKVALSGDGADELFGSYLPQRLAFPIENCLRLRGQGKTGWQDLSEADKKLLVPFDTPGEFEFVSSLGFEETAKWRDRLVVFSHEQRKELLSEEFTPSMSEPCCENIFQALAPELKAQDALNKTLELDQKELLVNQVLPFVDRLSMAHSIEVRCPFLDYRLVEYVNRLPGNLKIKNGITKSILKQAALDYLDEDLVTRPKEGFVQPIYTWMHGSLKKWIIDNVLQLPSTFFNLNYVNNLAEQFQGGDQSLNAKIWNLACFNIWYSQCLK